MHNRGLLVGGIVLVLIGALGLATVSIWGASRATRDGVGGSRASYASNGQRIYYTGVGHNGRIRVQWQGAGSMMGRRSQRAMMGCVTCHREDGRGGRVTMMGVTRRVPDIRYSTLIRPHEDEGGTSGWTRAQIATAIRTGNEPGGQTLDPLMPRWDMDDRDMTDTIDYLKELSDR